MATNTELFDILTRHQIYLEGVKEGQTKEFNKVLIELSNEFKRLFASLNYDTLDALTKVKLRNFLSRIKKVQSRIYSRYKTNLINDIKKFMSIDVDLNKRIFEDDTNRKIEQAYEEGDGSPLFGLAPFLETSSADERLWSTVSNSPLPANGVLLLPFISHFINSASSAVENTIRKAYANKWTKEQTLRAIIGSKSKNWRDGEFAKVYRQASAVIATGFQHVVSNIQAGIASIFYKRYVWNSVIDGGTTDICLYRNGKIFTFDKGPLPPAHIKCRSGIWPRASDNGVDLIDVSYYSWLKSQPSIFQNDILGNSRAARLRKGELNSKNFPKFVNAKPISIEEFRNKQSIILT